ncbi:hypothetical protein N7509_001610 [Penicillium cosmopolitanum]|uniref:Alpha/beta hydrolase fold-3 domain-containing protein n=1 Tax=Penicillium cosmopolitanum TaxID=1131564 RepID=A0A9X0BCI4_9EURO|nr:uncharacterized protein N7509_001610 [Penicillium cosmopolitanum]KAJ5407727.1 hypothetical protein N7509_001610 [Penicillium cosmopolitanum]
MSIKPKWLRDIASLVFTVYYLIAAEQADEKVRKVRGTLTLEHLRVSWNKATTPYLWTMAKLLRPRLTRYSARAIRIPRPKHSVHKDPVNAWLYFDGPLSALRDQKCLVLDIPGGGFVAMGPRSSEDKLLSWAGQLKVPVLSVDYKKAPEYAYPYALHECYDVYHTIMATNGRCLGMSGSARPRIVVTGESAGGNLAVGMTLMVLQSAMEQGWKGEEVLPKPDGLVLAYPALNVRVESWMTDEQMALIQDKSTRQTNSGILQRKQDQYRKLTPFTSPGHSVEDLTKLPSEEKQKEEANNVAAEASKALRDKLKKTEEINGKVVQQTFPKTYILTGERDPLVDDTVIFAGRLRQAKLHLFHERQDLGLEKSQRQFNEKDHVEVSLIPGVSHGFIQMAGFFPDAWKYINRSAKWIESIFESTDLHESEYSLLQLSHASNTTSEKRKGPYKAGWQTNGHSRHHHRNLTGESSADEDRPLEMGLSKLTSLPENENANASSSLLSRRKLSRSSFSSSQLKSGLANLDDSTGSGNDFLAKLKKLEMTANHDTFHPDEVNSAPESPSAFRPRGKSIASLDSEEDLLDRRMNGIAGGLMGLGEGAQTPGL